MEIDINNEVEARRVAREYFRKKYDVEVTHHIIRDVVKWKVGDAPGGLSGSTVDQDDRPNQTHLRLLVDQGKALEDE